MSDKYPITTSRSEEWTEDVETAIKDLQNGRWEAWFAIKLSSRKEVIQIGGSENRSSLSINLSAIEDTSLLKKAVKELKADYNDYGENYVTWMYENKSGCIEDLNTLITEVLNMTAGSEIKIVENLD